MQCDRFHRRCSAEYWLISIVILAFFIATTQTHAQFRASITGTVTDATNAVVPNAQLSLTDTDQNRILTTKSNASGIFSFNALPPSHFKLSVSADGFQGKVFDKVTIIPEQANTFNVQLAVGEVTESVSITADETTLLDTSTASNVGTVSENEIQHMPTMGRDVTQLTQLALGVFGDGGQSAGGGTQSLPGSNMAGTTAAGGIFKTENAPQIVANGGQNETNGIEIDGISTASAVWGGSTVITPSADSVDNVKVTSNAYDAEFGRFSGAQIQITSKSGANQVHGSFFFKGDRPGLNAYQSWNGPAGGLLRDESRFNQFGGSVGGPIWKDKVFAFFAYETLRNNSTDFANDWYETPQFLAKASSSSTAYKYTSYTGEGVNAASQLTSTCALLGLTEGTTCATVSGGVDIGSPLTTALGTTDPTYGGASAAEPGVGGGLDGTPDIADYTTANPTQITQTQYNGRLDANISAADRVTFTIYWVPQSTTDYDGPVRSANLWHHSQINDAFTLLWNHIFSPTLLNEARVNAAGWRWNEVNTNPDVPFGLAEANIGTSPNGLFPSGSSFNPMYLGAPGPSIYNQWTYGYQDILTKIFGRQTIKMGGSLTQLYYLDDAPYSARPSYIFRNMWDFLNDAPYSESGQFNPATGIPTANRQDMRQNLWAGFIQDDWKLKPNLTVNLGLRYSYFDALSAKQKNMSVVQLGTGSSMISGLTMRQGSQSLWTPQKGNFSPEIGFAYSPSNKMVFRGGFGINYNQNEIAITANNNGNSPNVLSETLLSGQLLYELPSNLKSLYGYSANSNAISSIGTNGLPTSTYVSVTAFDKKVPTIYTYHYSLDTQMNLSHNWVATVGYQGSTGRHIILQQDMQAIAAVNGYSLNSNLSGVDYYGNMGNSNYNALLSSVKHSFNKGYQVEAQYVWSKSMDNGSQPYYESPYPYDLHYSWGRSDFDVQNAFKLFGVYQPNFFQKNSLAHTALDGWTLTGIFNVHSGFPWNPTYTVSDGSLYFRNSAYTTLRPGSYLGGAKSSTSNKAFMAASGTANSNFPDSDNGLGYFTAPTYTSVSSSASILTTAGAPQAPGVARNALNGPKYKSLDASISKAFHLPSMSVLGDKATFEFRFDAFNVLNNLNLEGSSIVTSITSSSFGQAQSALGSRTVDLQARFSF
jgi:hypothetical protein